MSWPIHSNAFPKVLAAFFLVACAVAQQTPAPFVPKGINIPLSSNTVGGRPGIAFDGTNYLIVYRGEAGAAWGQRVSREGVILDPTGFKISTNPGTIREASVAFDGTNYMVVWELDVEPTEIYAARVTPLGVVLDSPEVQVTNGANAYPRPVATTFDGDNFLLVYRTAGSPFPRFGMRGLRMSKTAQSLDGPTGFPIFDGPAAYVSSAYDPVHQVHLAVWEDRRKVGTGPIEPSMDVDISGMRISKAGAVLDAQPILISTETSNASIQAPVLEQRAPGVAFNGEAFLVAWYDARPDAIAEQGTLYGARVAPDGTLLDQPSFQIGDNYSSADVAHTPVACDENDCVVAWMYESSRGYNAGYGYRGGIYTRGVKRNGQIYDRGIAASSNFGSGFFPIMGVSSGQVLVAWIDQRLGTQSVYAQLMERGAGPAPVPLQPSGDDQPTPFSYTGFNSSDFVTGLGGADERHVYAITLSGDFPTTSLHRLQGNGWVIDRQYRFGGGRVYALASSAADLVWAVGQGPINLYKVPLGVNSFGCCSAGNAFAVQVFGSPGYAPDGIQVFSVGSRGLRQRFTIHPENFIDSNSYSILGEQFAEYSDPQLDLGGLWGSSPANVYAVGEFGTVLHFDGNTWSKVANIPTLQALNAVWGSGNHVFAAGDFGTVVHFDGSAWSVMETGTSEHLFGIWGFNPDDIYAVGTHFSVFHYDGTAWHHLLGGCCRILLREVWGAGNRLFVAGESGQLLSLNLAGYNPTPGLNSIQPNSTIARNPGFTLSVNGEGFQANSVVRWNGSDRPTIFDNGGHLSASISVGDVTAPGTTTVSVFTPGPGGGTSQVLPFIVQAQAAVSFSNNLGFGNVLVGTSSPQQDVTITSTGTAPLQIASIGSSGEFVQTNDCPQSLAINGSCTIHVHFVPTFTGNRSGTIQIVDNAPGSPQAINLSGNGVQPAIQVLPTTKEFGGVTMGTNSSPQAFIVSNTGSAALAINGVFTTGDYSQTNDCPGQLAPAQACTVSVTFSPAALGDRFGGLYIAHNAQSSPALVGLHGVGNTGPLPQLQLSSSSLTFTPVIVGLVGPPLPLTLSNTGPAELHIFGLFSGNEWPITTCGEVLAAFSNCTIYAYFQPGAVGQRSGTLRILSNAPGSPHLVGLSGTGSTLTVTRPSRPTRSTGGGTAALDAFALGVSPQAIPIPDRMWLVVPAWRPLSELPAAKEDGAADARKKDRQGQKRTP